ncbi:MAG: 50S ribosomal protein L11 methyltransferase [Thermodesulfobacteriota bacterium]
MLDIEVEVIQELAGDLATRLMARWPGLEVKTEENSVCFRLPLTEALDRNLKDFEETLQALEKARGLNEELYVRCRNLAGPDLGPEKLIIGRFLIRRPDVEVKPEPDQIVLALEAGHAFGTGGHPSTALVLTALQEFYAPRPGCPSRANSRVLDAGTGSGILALAAARLGGGPILAVDPLPEAVATARANAALNDLSDRLEIVQTSAEKITGRFDLVLGNLVPAVLLRTAKKLVPLLEAEGWLIVSGFADSQTHQVMAALTRAGLMAVKSYSRDGWGALSLTWAN